MAIKKSELYSYLWASCDELRGGMDASQYKDYVLVLLFVKYVSDKYAGKKNALIEIPKGGSFEDLVALKGKKDIGDKTNTIIAKLAEANDLKGIIDVADFNNPDKLGKDKDMVDKLTSLVGIFQELNFSKNRAEGDDLLGDAYEYLMRNFATESGKSKGQFYTPAEVSRIMAKVIGISEAKRQDQTIYDPTCGSGSLLLKAADEAKVGVTIYGQEMDNATRALAKMNMILHDNPTAEILQGNSISNPLFKDKNGKLKTFDFLVANPPFSTKTWSNGIDPANDPYERFADGIPPKKNGDFAFLLHMIRSLKSTGKAAVILPHGVLFRGNTEAEIRKNIIRKGYIKGIISLPPNLFFGTGIPACIIVIDKENAEARKGIFMIDASKGFMKDGNKNRLRHQDVHKIVDVFTKQMELPKYSRMVKVSEIETNDYNLNIPRYIDSSEEEDLQDIEAHLLGEIPNRDIDLLENYWKVCSTLRSELFSTSRNNYSALKVESLNIKKCITEHKEFQSFVNKTNKSFDAWKEATEKDLSNIKVGSKPKELIGKISENLLETFDKVHLIDAYDVYQHLMTYWSDVMQDDVYLVSTEGWDATKTLTVIHEKDKKQKEKPDIVISKKKIKAEVIPPSLIVAKYFSSEQKAINDLETQLETLTQQIQEYEEEHSGEEGVLEDHKNDKGAIAGKSVQARIKEIAKDTDSKEELDILKRYIDFTEQESELAKKIKAAKAELDEIVVSKYEKLSTYEIKELVIQNKWLTTIKNDIQQEISRISQSLSQRIRELAERYETPMPRLSQQVDELMGKVDSHLNKMGFKW